MFICEDCIKEHYENEPDEFLTPRSHGRCEICNKGAICFDIPTKHLIPKKEAKSIGEIITTGVIGTGGDLPNLDKETFWNEIMDKYPIGMERFCNWIDQYKLRVDWNSMFAANENTDQLHSSKYKYHDLPLAMQVGIFIQYALETADEKRKVRRFLNESVSDRDFTMQDFPDRIRNYFHVNETGSHE